MKEKSLSRVRLLATPLIAAYQAPPSMGFSRQEYWSGVPLPSPVQSLSRVQLFATPWTIACRPSLSFTISWSLIKLMSIELMMPSNYLILCRPASLPALNLFWHQHQSRGQFPDSSTDLLRHNVNAKLGQYMNPRLWGQPALHSIDCFAVYIFWNFRHLI